MCEETNHSNVVVTTTQPGVYHQASLRLPCLAQTASRFLNGATLALVCPLQWICGLLIDTTCVPAHVFCMKFLLAY